MVFWRCWGWGRTGLPHDMVLKTWAGINWGLERSPAASCTSGRSTLELEAEAALLGFGRKAGTLYPLSLE